VSEQAAEPEPDGQLEQRVTTIEEKIDKILGLVSSKGPAHAQAEAVTQERLDAPGSVAEEVERELARRDDAAKAAQREEEFGSIKDTVAKLTEKRPESPVRKVEHVMGWRG
jgi:hypothetical protein